MVAQKFFKMLIKEFVPLAPLTTFKVGGAARYFAEVTQAGDLPEVMRLVQHTGLPLFIFGGGSNMVVADRGLNAVVLQPRLQGIKVVAEDQTWVEVQVAAGENWDAFVAHTVAQGWWGVENLSAIPGSCGGAPIQNIGAYGQEVKDTISAVEVYDLQRFTHHTFTNQECAFGYRQSRFNQQDKGRYLVVSVTFRLSKMPRPQLSYQDVAQALGGVVAPTQQQIRDTIIAIRSRKLPNPDKMGNAGSFFKNLLLNVAEFEQLRGHTLAALGHEVAAKLDEYRTQLASEAGIKIPTAYLITACGLKGLQVGGAAVNETQALVIYNKTGQATAADVLALAVAVRDTVKAKTGARLVAEPQFVGFNDDELKGLWA